MSSFNRILKRLHSVFNKDAQPQQIISFVNIYPDPIAVEFMRDGIRIGKFVTVPITPETTIADMITAVNATMLPFDTYIQLTLTNAAYGQKLAIGLQEQTVELAGDSLGIFLLDETGYGLRTEEGEPIYVEEYNA